MNPYIPVLAILIFAVIFACLVSGLSWLLGPRKYNKTKFEPYECGVPMASSARERMSVKFYLTAILFILFDIETILLYLWVKAFPELGWFGVIQGVIFIGILAVGEFFVIKRGALEWD